MTRRRRGFRSRGWSYIPLVIIFGALLLIIAGRLDLRLDANFNVPELQTPGALPVPPEVKIPPLPTEIALPPEIKIPLPSVVIIPPDIQLPPLPFVNTTPPALQAPTATPEAPAPAPKPPPVGGWYQIHFTTPRYPDVAAERRGGIDATLTGVINNARTSVDVAIYQLDLPNVTQALSDASRRGAAVRVVTDIEIFEDSTENASLLQLQAAGIPVVAGNPNAIMHNKFVVVDRAAVWTGSYNLTVNDTYRYNNNAILIQSPELARNYTATFEKMFDGKAFGPSRRPGGTTPRLTIGGAPVESFFTPEDPAAASILARLGGAKQSIEFMAFSFTDDEMGRAIIERAGAGVRVRGVFETTGSTTQFSEFNRMKQAGLDVMQDGNPYLMHHKVFIVDGVTVIFGSYNFSENAKESNDENVLIVDDAALAQAFQAEFARVYGQAKSPPRK